MTRLLHHSILFLVALSSNHFLTQHQEFKDNSEQASEATWCADAYSCSQMMLVAIQRKQAASCHHGKHEATSISCLCSYCSSKDPQSNFYSGDTNDIQMNKNIQHSVSFFPLLLIFPVPPALPSKERPQSSFCQGMLSLWTWFPTWSQHTFMHFIWQTDSASHSLETDAGKQWRTASWGIWAADSLTEDFSLHSHSLNKTIESLSTVFV